MGQVGLEQLSNTTFYSQRNDVSLRAIRHVALREKAYLFKRKGFSLRERRHISLSVPIYPFNLPFLPSLFATKMVEMSHSTFEMRSETDFFQRLFLRQREEKVSK